MSVGPLGAFPPELASSEAQLHPQSFYATMHEAGPVRWDPARDCWDVYGYAAVKEAMNDPTRFSVAFAADPDFEMPADGRLITGRSLLYQDPPKHDELRTVVEDFFKPGPIGKLEPAIRSLARDYVETALDQGIPTGDGVRVDLVETITYPFPVSVIAELIGVPPADREQFRAWSTQAVAASGHNGPDEDEMRAFRHGLIDYFERLAAERRADPRDDLISKVLATESLDPDEMLGFFAILLIAGNITTTTLISNAVWTLVEEGALDDVRDDPEAIELAIEEVIRFRSPVQTHTRFAVADTELAGEPIEAGDRLGLWIGAANRDPSVFDRPDEFVPDRRPNQHIGFGYGSHFCLGAHLARLEARVALEVLFEHVEDIAVHVDDMHPSGSVLVYGPGRMPVTLTPADSVASPLDE